MNVNNISISFSRIEKTASGARIMVVPALKLEGIDKCFPGTQALQDVSFEAYPGKVSSLVGANGAGKSTLIKIVSGAIGKDSGTISLNGEHVEISGPAHAQELEGNKGDRYFIKREGDSYFIL